MDDQKKSSGTLMWTVGVVVLALIAYGVYAYTDKKSDTTNTNGTDTTTTVTPPTSDTGSNTGSSSSDNSSSAASTYKDGTYSAEGDYTSPGGAEAITVTVTLKDDVITDANVVSLKAEQPESSENQNRFISGFKSQVIGKKITDVHLTRVSGSSLTPIGWNNAIAKIETQAQA